ncbi:hypothetical protein GQ457_09G026060 [Hibiscus cannabinus]
MSEDSGEIRNPIARTESLPSGRPPDLVQDSDVLTIALGNENTLAHSITAGPILERPGSPFDSETQGQCKKSRSEGVQELDTGSDSMKVEENSQTLEGSTGSDGGSAILSKSGDDRFRKPDQGGNLVSYADIVGGLTRGDDKDKDGAEKLPCDPNKVEVLDEDCVIDKSGKFPTIKFSERVHKLIDSNMRNVIIVRLLGRNIGYQTLLNRIYALWKPAGEVQLIDLENNYFLVRVEDPRDYKKILTDGPWTIYGNYLTVQPWSRSFSTLEKHPSRVVVWVRLPGLPYRYYSKAPFRRIAKIVGDVVKVDYNTKAGERGKFARLAVTVDLNKPLVPCIGIDGFIQNLEYEGLHHICYSCGVYGHLQEYCGSKDGQNEGAKKNPIVPEREKATNEECNTKRELFGPWMTVDSRRKRTQARGIPSEKITGPMGTENVNRFAMLEDDQTATREEQGLELGAGISPERVEQGPPSGNSRPSAGVRGSTTAVRNSVTHRGSTSTGNAKGNSRKAEMAVVLPMVEGQQVSIVEHSVLGGNSEHTAVSLFEKGHGNVRSKGVVHGKLHGIRRGIRDGVQQGLKIRKPQDTRTIPRPVLSEWVDTMQLHIKALSTQAENDPRGPTRAVVNQDGKLEPAVRTLDTPGVRATVTGEPSALTEDGSGASGPTFHRFFLSFKREHLPQLVALFEPRIGGRRADGVIKNFGYPHSFRVEAQGFSGGIWLLWEADIEVEILHVSNQFINGRTRGGLDSPWVQFTMVYASPSSARRRNLWSQLLSLDPEGDIPWVVGGDFNVILCADERRGGSSAHVQGSRPFAEFLCRSGLHDMGFRGSPFTWSRGNLYERLDRCLANNSWVSCFPHSYVCHLEKNGSDHRPLLLCSEEMMSEDRPRPFRYIMAWQEHPSFQEFLKSVWGTVKRAERLDPAGGGLAEVEHGWGSVFGRCSVVEAELWGIATGMDLAWNLGCRHLIIESDSSEALQMVQQHDSGSDPYIIVSYIRQFCNKDWNILFSKVARSNNLVADWLAKFASDTNFDVMFFESPPDGLDFG